MYSNVTYVCEHEIQIKQKHEKREVLFTIYHIIKHYIFQVLNVHFRETKQTELDIHKLHRAYSVRPN